MKMEGIDLTYAKSAKYLEVMLDDRLNFREHVELKCASATRVLMAGRKALGKKLGHATQARQVAQ